MKKKKVQVKLPVCPCVVCTHGTETCDCSAWREWFCFTWPYLTEKVSVKVKGKG